MLSSTSPGPKLDYAPPMALLTSLSFETVSQALKDYGLELVKLEPMQEGSVNSNFRIFTQNGDRYFARLYEEQDRAGAEAELRLVTELAGLGVPTAPAQKRLDGALVSELMGKAFAVYPWIEGEILCQARVTEARTYKLGRALAQLHLATAAVTPLGEGRFGPEQLSERLELVLRSGRQALIEVALKIRQRLEQAAARRNLNLPAGVVHTDLFRDNVLWRGDEIGALIDFESAARGPFAYDLMVTLLAWCYSDFFEPTLMHGLFTGYDDVRPLSQDELEALELEGYIACLRFATTRLTDFSLRAPPGTPPARSFDRFLQRMSALEAGALTSVLSGLRGTRVGAKLP